MSLRLGRGEIWVEIASPAARDRNDMGSFLLFVKSFSLRNLSVLCAFAVKSNLQDNQVNQAPKHSNYSFWLLVSGLFLPRCFFPSVSLPLRDDS
jgi:hypothetical protein